MQREGSGRSPAKGRPASGPPSAEALRRRLAKIGWRLRRRRGGYLEGSGYYLESSAERAEAEQRTLTINKADPVTLEEVGEWLVALEAGGIELDDGERIGAEFTVPDSEPPEPRADSEPQPASGRRVVFRPGTARLYDWMGREEREQRKEEAQEARRQWRENRGRIVGARIRARREDLLMDLEVLALEIGVSRSTVQRIESGAQAPNVYVAMDLAAALDTTIEALFGEEGER